MPIVNNDTELILAFEKDLDEIIENVTEKVLQDLKDIIQNVVYDPYTQKVQEYQRTMQFKDSWEKDQINSFKPSLNGVEIENRVFNNFTKMLFVPLLYQHGSDLSGDISKYLAEILNEGKTGSIFGSANPPAWWRTDRPFWDVFIQQMNNGSVFRYIEQEFNRKGIIFRRF